MPDGRGSLTIVGTGILVSLQTTAEARHGLETAEKVFYLINNPVAANWVRGLNASAESLADCYGDDKNRMDSYREMVERILSAVRSGLAVHVAFYGHPGVFVWPAHEAIRRARREGLPAHLLPGVSAEDCLFADLGVDPAERGCQSFEATDFLLRHRRRFDPASALVLWQIGVLGNETGRERRDPRALPILAEALLEHYPGDHEVVIYEAASLPLLPPRTDALPLSALAEPGVRTSFASTLYVPPLPAPDPDPEMARRLAALLES